MEIGVIGFGRFGALIVRELSKKHTVFVSSSKSVEEISAVGGIKAELEMVCTKKIVIPAVPIGTFEKTIENINQRLSDDALVIDVCSVKEYPVQVMEHLLPKNVSIVATHPLFGPDSAAETVAGQKIVVSKIRVDDARYAAVISDLKELNLEVVEATPEEHDRAIANTLFLTHHVGRLVLNQPLPATDIRTDSYDRLKRMCDFVSNDTEQLYQDMKKYNRFTKQVVESFKKTVNDQ